MVAARRNLISAIRFSVVLSLSICIDAGREIEAKGLCEICEAIRVGDTIAVERLRETVEGSRYVYRGLELKYLLHLTASFGTPEMADYLFTHGFDANERAWMQMAPLHIAAYHGGPSGVAERLIEAGADIEQLDGYRRTPLLWAAEMGHLEIVELLLKHGADPQAKDRRGRTAAVLAAENGKHEVAALLRTYLYSNR